MDLGSLPPRLRRRLRRRDDGRVDLVPWFASDSGPAGTVDPAKVMQAFARRLCWACGQTRGIHTAYLCDPHTAQDQQVRLPGMHSDCADWTAANCPFLTSPGRRNPAAPARTAEQIGQGVVVLARNPGVQVVLVTDRDHVDRVNGSRPRVFIGVPVSVRWYVAGLLTPKDQVAVEAEAVLDDLLVKADEDIDRDGARLDFRVQHDAIRKVLRW